MNYKLQLMARKLNKKIFNCYKKYILYYANIKYPPVRKRKYTLEYYLDNFINVLNDLTKWEAITKLKSCKGEAVKHWKTIYNEYLKWSKDGIFETAFTDLIKYNYFKLSKVKKVKQLNILIDVTKITNKGGSEKVGMNVEYKKKNVTCLSVVCDDNKFPLAVSTLDVNGTKTKKGKNKFIHEIRGVQKTLNKIPIDVKPYVKINLIGDKGYISNNTFNIMNQTVKIITPKRKNQKTKNTKKDEQLLKKRYRIENFFSVIKKKDRVNIRKDKKESTYLGFVYITFIEYVIKKYKNIQIT